MKGGLQVARRCTAKPTESTARLPDKTRRTKAKIRRSILNYWRRNIWTNRVRRQGRTERLRYRRAMRKVYKQATGNTRTIRRHYPAENKRTQLDSTFSRIGIRDGYGYNIRTRGDRNESAMKRTNRGTRFKFQQ